MLASEEKTQDIPRAAVPFDLAVLYLGMKPGGLRWLLFNKQGPRHVKIGRRFYFRLVDLDQYLLDHLVDSEDE